MTDRPDRLIQYHSDRYNSEIQSDVSMLSNEDQSLVKLALNKEWTNPKYKLRYFVGHAQITPYAKFRQWLLEIKSKEESIENMEYELAKHDVEYERFKRMAEQAQDDLDRKFAEIEMWNRDRLRYTSKRRLQDWYLERQQLIDLCQEFLESEESQLNDGTGRSYKDILDTEEEDIYEAEYWTNRLAKQAACDMLFYGRVNSGNMDAILSMPPEQQAETLALTINYSTQIQNYQLQLQKNADLALANGMVDNKSLTTPVQSPEAKPLTAPENNNTQEMFDVYSLRNHSE